jgi:hypothetical protein
MANIIAGAGAAQRIAHVGDLENRGALAAELGRDLDTQQFLIPRRIDGGLRKARFAVDRLGLCRSRRCDHGGSLQEGAAVEQNLFCGRSRRQTAEPGILDIHRRYSFRDSNIARVAAPHRNDGRGCQTS